MRSYLVQRGIFKHEEKENIVGIDSLINFEYMGSAEFEFGALPESLNRIIGEWKNFDVFETSLKDSDGGSVFVICKKTSKSEVEKCLIELSEKKHRTKEISYFQEYLNGKHKTDRYIRTRLWWDIDNDWMACPGKQKIELVKFAIEKVIEKRKKS